MSTQFTDETGAVQVGAGGSAGSWEFGASTPSSSAGVFTVDGVAVNNGTTLASGIVPPAANNRTTGSATVPSNGSVNVSTGKAANYCAFTVDHAATNIYVSTITVATITILDCGGGLGASRNYGLI
jgi:hypothetical protein